MSDIEIERTYLAARLPPLEQALRSTLMVDHYFPNDLEEHAQLRVRLRGDVMSLTKKTPINEGDASAHIETTIPLTQFEYHDLVAASTRSIMKRRFVLSETSEIRIEVDVFAESLSGLILVDFEFESNQSRDEFVAPDFCLVEVTNEEFLAGGVLSGRSYVDIEPELRELSYMPIGS